MEGKFAHLSRFPEKYHEKLDDYEERLKTYAFSVVLVKDAPSTWVRVALLVVPLLAGKQC